jgi:hypothetical protein
MWGNEYNRITDNRKEGCLEKMDGYLKKMDGYLRKIDGQ